MQNIKKKIKASQNIIVSFTINSIDSSLLCFVFCFLFLYVGVLGFVVLAYHFFKYFASSLCEGVYIYIYESNYGLKSDNMKVCNIPVHEYV